MFSALSTIDLMLQGTGTLRKEMPSGKMCAGKYTQIHANTQKMHYRHAFLPSCFPLSSLSYTDWPKHYEKWENNHSTHMHIRAGRDIVMWPQRKLLVWSHYLCMPTHWQILRNKHMEECPLGKTVHPNICINGKKNSDFLHFMSTFSLTSPFVICWIPFFISFLSIGCLRSKCQNWKLHKGNGSASTHSIQLSNSKR